MGRGRPRLSGMSWRGSRGDAGAPWFVAADVCRALGLLNPTDALKVLAADQRRLERIEGMRGSPANLISESGLYKLVLRSDKAEGRSPDPRGGAQR